MSATDDTKGGVSHLLNIPQGDAQAQIHVPKYLQETGPLKHFLKETPFIPTLCKPHVRVTDETERYVILGFQRG